MSHSIEIILSRQWADCLSIPVFLTDPKGNLLFYNEPAEDILGKRFEETGFMPVEEWSVLFKPQDENGDPISGEQLPLVRTLTHRLPSRGDIWIESLNGNRYHLSVTAFPIIGMSKAYHGAIAIFWTNDE